MVSIIQKPLDENSDLLIHAYLDRELDAAGNLAVEQMIGADPVLADKVNSIRVLQGTLRKEFEPEAIPLSLKKRLDAAVGKSARPIRPTWHLMAASVVAAMALSSSVTWLALRSSAPNIMLTELVDGHMRALSAPQPTDIVSSDRHTVKPWFTGKIPQSPKVVDLAGEGFPLVGARIDVFAKTPVPTLVYGRRRHLISLSAVSAAEGMPHTASPPPVNGYNIVSWNVGDTTYWALSDLNVTELREFATLFQKAS